MYSRPGIRMIEMTATEKDVCRAIDDHRAARDRRIDMLQGHIANRDWHAAMDECCDIQCEEEAIKSLRTVLDN